MTVCGNAAKGQVPDVFKKCVCGETRLAFGFGVSRSAPSGRWCRKQLCSLLQPNLARFARSNIVSALREYRRPIDSMPMLPRVLHRRLGRFLCLIIGATLVFSLVVLNDSPHLPRQPSLRALQHQLRSKLPRKMAAHVDEELDVEIFGEAGTLQLQVPRLSLEDGGEVERPNVGGRKTFGRHVWRSDGLLEVNPQGRHPIYDLVDKAKKKWNAKVARQSTTLRGAVREYKRRYQRDPPLGFDRW